MPVAEVTGKVGIGEQTFYRCNGYIESMNGTLRDKCLNLDDFFTLADAGKSASLASGFAATCSNGGKDGEDGNKQQPIHRVA